MDKNIEKLILLSALISSISCENHDDKGKKNYQKTH